MFRTSVRGSCCNLHVNDSLIEKQEVFVDSFLVSIICYKSDESNSHVFLLGRFHTSTIRSYWSRALEKIIDAYSVKVT